MKRVVLFGPREEILDVNPELEYRERVVESYEELLDRGAALGSDYTSSREFLGIECLAAVLRRRGDTVRVLGSINEGLDAAAGIEEILRFEPDVLGVSLLYDLQLYNGLLAARHVKARRPETVVVFGGPLASVIPDVLMSTFSFIDYLVKGEGEEPMARLLDALEAGSGLDTVPDLYWRRDGQVVRNPAGPTVDLDALPFASRDALASLRARNLPILSAYIYTSRGCKAHCTFCTVPGLAKGRATNYRFRDPALVVDEMESVIANYDVRTFYMADDNFLGYGEESRERLLALADEILRRGVKLSFHAECRVDSLDDQVLGRLREAGFDQILLGLESGSDRTLKRWAKGQTVEQNVRAIETARRFRFDLAPSMILLDWESTTEEVAESVAFVESTRVYECNYPLWLVNKLKVHCGTAAGRRYEIVHGVADRPPIHDDASLKRWVQVLTYQDTPIENPYVAEFWRCLSLETNRWSVLSSEVVPRLLLDLRRSREPEHRKLFGACRLWRRTLGAMLAGLMRELIDEVRRREAAGQPPGDLREIANAYVAGREAAIFPEGMDVTLRRYAKASVSSAA
jgi:radical SAM superfamily enzyme YgiQ (UPF0313 family)